MQVRPVTEADVAAFGAFVTRHADRAMFMGHALSRFGLVASEHPNAARFWTLTGDGDIRGALSLSNAGYVTVVAGGPDEMPDRGWQALAAAVAGARIRGLNGSDDAVQAFRKAAALPSGTARLDRADPHFALDLSDLIVPGGPGQARIAAADDLPVLADWRWRYEVEVLGAADTAGTRAGARERAVRMVEERAAAVLEEHGTLLSMTVFNARMPGAVQVGGVYTPPARRGRGHARRVVAQHLAMARDEGTGRAILFAASDAAASAYRAIGFVRIGDYRLIDFAEPAAIGAGL